MTTREAFEEWAIEAGYSVERIAYDPDNFLSGQYKSILTNTCWDAWQAATDAALAAPATAPDEQVRRDAERVAWYENNPEKVLNIGFRWYSRNGYGLPMKRRKGFREAIDAAMKETP